MVSLLASGATCVDPGIFVRGGGGGVLVPLNETYKFSYYRSYLHLHFHFDFLYLC